MPSHGPQKARLDLVPNRGRWVSVSLLVQSEETSFGNIRAGVTSWFVGLFLKGISNILLLLEK